MKNNSSHRKWFIALCWCAFLALCIAVSFTIVCNLLVQRSAAGKIYSDIDSIPYRKVGLVLGTSPTNARGYNNYYYIYRMEAAAQLYHAHKVSYLLVSGDNHKMGYNEPEEMRKSLVALGVPDSAIVLDYAGFRTFDSMVRAKKVFGQSSLTIISQHWHNERAIYIATHQQMEAIAFNAKDVKLGKSYIKSHLRERLAKVKVVLDVIFDKQPKFLGEEIVIGEENN